MPDLCGVNTRSVMSPAGSNGFCHTRASEFAVLTSQVPPDQREAWYERRLRDGMQVCIAHPRLVPWAWTCCGRPQSTSCRPDTPSTHCGRQSRRSWRIGQRSNVVVHFLTYNDTMQTSCLRLMGKKLWSRCHGGQVFQRGPARYRGR